MLHDNVGEGLETCCERLVQASYDAGGKDNITVMLATNDMPVPESGRIACHVVESHNLSGHSEYFPLDVPNDGAYITSSESVTEEFATTQVYAVKPKSQLDYDALEDHVGNGVPTWLIALIVIILSLGAVGLLVYLGIISF